MVVNFGTCTTAGRNAAMASDACTATERGVLGVVRAARPVLRSAHDRLAYAVHAAFLSVGYSLTATGSRAASNNPEGQESLEVDDAGWNEMEGAYAFLYSGAGQEGLCKAVLVKCIAVDDMLMVDVAPLDGEGNEEPLHLDIKVADYTTTLEGTNYGQLYKNLYQLVEKVNTQLLTKLSGRIKSHAPVRGQSMLERETNEERAPHFGVGIAEEVPSSMPGLVYPPLPSIGGSDLLPGPGAGVFPSRADPGVGGGMLLGPNDPRWGGVGYGGRMGFDEGGTGIGIPPGARYDPIGPPGVPGFEPRRFARSRRPPGGGGINPDLEHFQPF